MSSNRCHQCGCYDPLRQNHVDYSVRECGRYYWLSLEFPNGHRDDRIAMWVWGEGFRGIDPSTIRYVHEVPIERPN